MERGMLAMHLESWAMHQCPETIAVSIDITYSYCFYIIDNADAEVFDFSALFA